jgi:outer membrane protein assembly factor BamB
MPPRAIVKSTLALDEQWRFRTGPHNSWSSTPPHLFVTNGKAIISYGAGQRYGDQDFASWLTALSLENGQIIWQTRFEKFDTGTSIGSSHLDTERLYLLYSFRVNAFSLETGELLWSTPNLGSRTTYIFRPNSSDPLLLHTSRNQEIAIDPHTGAVVSRQPGYELMQYDQIDFVKTREGLYAVDQLTGRMLWQKRLKLQPAYRQLQYWPSFINDEMVFQSGDPLYTIIRANIKTGQFVWETEWDYVSNYALSGARVYALRQDATLIALDLNSGEVVGSVTFDSPASEVGSRPYWVVADGPYVLVYFGDSRELIVLKENTAQPSNNDTPLQTDAEHFETDSLDDQGAINLELGDKKVSIAISQNGQNIPLGVNERRVIQLKPEPFRLRLYGDAELVSLMTFRDAQLSPLEQFTQPAIVFKGTGRAWGEPGDLLIQDEPLELHQGTASYFVDEWHTTPERAVEFSSYLEKHIGTIPDILDFGRFYLAATGNTEDLTVYTLDGTQMRAGESILLVIFLENPIGQTSGVKFSQAKWLEFPILFSDTP